MLEILSNYLRNKIHVGYPRFFQITSNTKHEKPPRFFQITYKKAQGVPEIVSNYFRKKNTKGPQDSFKLSQDSSKLLQKQDPHGIPEILSNYFKNTTHRESLIFFQNYFKNKTLEVLGILSNYPRNKTHMGYPRFFRTTLKTKHEGPLRFLQIT